MPAHHISRSWWAGARKLAGPTLRQDSHFASLDPHSALGDELDGLGIGLAFGLKDPRGEGVGRIVVQHGDGPLKNHGAVIVLVVGEMDRTAAEFGTIVDYGLVYVMAIETVAAKRRNQARMDVRHAAGKVVGNGDPLEESGHDDQVCLGRAAGIENRPAELLLGGKTLGLDDCGGNAGIAGELQSPGPGLLETTRAICTCNRPARIFSIKFFNVVPPPEMSTAMRKGGSMMSMESGDKHEILSSKSETNSKF